MTSQQNSASISLKTIFLILFQSRLCFIYKVLLLIFGLSTSFSLLVNEAGMYNAQARHKAQVKMELAMRGSLQSRIEKQMFCWSMMELVKIGTCKSENL